MKVWEGGEKPNPTTTATGRASSYSGDVVHIGIYTVYIYIKAQFVNGHY